jgi:glycosyltransferase involved in cell wall biosynthesis
MTKISLIIPAHNEIQLLPRLLDTVDVSRERYVGGREAIEVIVADNASTDGTDELAASRGCVVAPVEKRLIAAARNGGARVEQCCVPDDDDRSPFVPFATDAKHLVFRVGFEGGQVQYIG